MISLVIPVRNEEENVVRLQEKIVEAMSAALEPYEVIFVNDGSTDGTMEKLKTITKIKIISFARGFGQTSALDAGLHEAVGEVIITMDGDLQNDPADIPLLISKIREGYDVASGWRQERQDSGGRKVLSHLANWLTAKVTGLYLHDSACALKAYRRDVVQAIHLYGEMHVFLPAYLYGRGARVIEVPVRHHARKFGISKHYFFKAVKNLFDLLTIKFLVTMTGRPLVLFGGIGAVSFFTGVAVSILAVYLKLAHLRNFGQTPLPILAIFFVLSGFIFFMLGFLAELMLRVYFEGNHKTPYIIRERLST